MYEKRRYTRIPYTAHIELVKENGEKISGEVVNICLKGAYVSSLSKFTMELNEVVAFSIAFDEIHDIVVTGSALVMRQDALKGYGLYFASIDLSGLGDLKRIIAINYKNSQKIEQEFEELVK